MPRPDSATTIQRPDLGAIAYEYLLEASQRGFIGLELLPLFDTPLQTSTYPVIKIESLLKLQETKRSPRADYNRSDYEFKDGYYACHEHGWEELVDDSEAAMYRRFFDAEVVAVQRCIDVILRNQEARIAAKVQNTAVITNTAAASTPWSTVATCTPRTDVTNAKKAMRAASGLTPNVMTISKAVFDTLLLCKEIMDALKYTNPIEIGGEEAQRRILAQYFGVDKVLVGNAIKDSAKKGQAASLVDIWDDEYCGLYKVSGGGQDLKDPCLGRTFLWTEDSPENLVVEQYREEKKRSEVYRARHNVDEAFVFTKAGYLISDIIHP